LRGALSVSHFVAASSPKGGAKNLREGGNLALPLGELSAKLTERAHCEAERSPSGDNYNIKETKL